MRALCLALLLTNILVLAWSLWIAPAKSSSGALAPAADPASIRRVGEAPSDSANKTAGSRATAAPCVSVGPFIDSAPLQRVAGRLEKLGYTAHSRVSTESVRIGQWVSVPDLATPEDATNAISALRTVSITDAYVAPDSGPGIVVSVGVFNESERAEEAAAMVRRAGLTPRITDRTRTEQVTWLDVDRAANAGLPELSDLADAAVSASPALEMRACPGAG